MGVQNRDGFTLIETMLFLAITGLMIAGLLVGASANINRQRYNDAVSTLQSDIQALYADVQNVRNDRGQIACTESSGELSISAVTDALEDEDVDAGLPASSISRGQSDCVLMGKLMTVTGGVVNKYDIVGRRKEGYSGSFAGVQGIKEGYVKSAYRESRETTEVPWGARSVVDAGNPYVTILYAGLNIAVIRSPEMGSVYTFSTVRQASDGETVPDVNGLLVEKQSSGTGTMTYRDVGTNTLSRTLIVDSCGMSNATQAIVINANATGPDAITMRPYAQGIPGTTVSFRVEC